VLDDTCPIHADGGPMAEWYQVILDEEIEAVVELGR
jgi:hypothetical protein